MANSEMFLATLMYNGEEVEVVVPTLEEATVLITGK